MYLNANSFSKTGRLAIAVSLSIFLLACMSNPERAKQRYARSGNEYLKTGKYEESILQFRNALKIDPRYVDAFYGLAQAYLSEHDYTSAYNAIEQAIALNPKRLDLRLTLAQVYFLSHQFANAEETAKYVLKRDPRSAGAYQVLGTSLLAEGKKDSAIEALLKVIELKPQDPSTYGTLGLVEMSLRRDADAEKHFRTATEQAPHFAQGFENLSGFLRLRARGQEAEDVLKRGLEKNPDDSELRLSWADLLYSEQKKGLAEDALRELRDRHPHSADTALTIGNFYFSRGETNKALVEYERGLAIDSHHREIENQIVESLLVLGRIKEAETLNARILKERPKDSTAMLARSRILLANNRREEAITLLRNLVAQSQDSPQAHYFLGLAYWQNQNLQQAKTEFQETLRETPGLVLAQHSLAELHMALGELQPARELAEQIVKTDPGSADQHMLLGTIYIRQGQAGAAREQFLIARRLTPGDAPAAFDLAQADKSDAKWDEAEHGYEAALALNPRFVQALNGLASLWIERNQRAKALARVAQYIATYPDDPAGHLIIGSIYSEEKRYEAAREEFRRAAELAPQLAIAHAQIGNVSRVLGDTNAAIQAYERAAALEPQAAGLDTLLGNLYLEQKNWAAAEKHYQQALARNPNDAIAANNLAWIYLNNGGNLDVALGLAQKAKQAQPEFVNLTDTLGWIQYRKGLYAGAVSLLQDCVAKAPQSAVYRYHLGMALLGNGDGRSAKAQLETALRLQLAGEDAEQARRALQRLN